LPNVRLANGVTRQETRQKLMLSFNTPFYPDILVASSVLAEGVDLHLNCRFVLHHDLSWNPSDIEQRTGRVDRIECKAEKVMRPVEIFLPFVAETQDEKQFRVVMDRERWFQVLMGEDYRVDDASIEEIAQRIPLPPSAARALSFALEVVQADTSSIPTNKAA
jgi:superfamily II DNA/RNA helicase